MTLKEKFIDAFKSGKRFDIQNAEKIADDYAIEFYRWMRVNDTQENADKYFHYTDKDMLNAFKEQKGL
jgi:hypothetical protein